MRWWSNSRCPCVYILYLVSVRMIPFLLVVKRGSTVLEWSLLFDATLYVQCMYSVCTVYV